MQKIGDESRIPMVREHMHVCSECSLEWEHSEARCLLPHAALCDDCAEENEDLNHIDELMPEV